MNILHLISSGGMYGAEAVILNLSSSLRQQGHQSTLGILTNASGGHLQLQQAALAQGLVAHLVPCRGAFDLGVTGRIRALATSSGADVVHMHGYKADVYGFLALRGGPAALTSTCHTWYDNDLALRLYGMLDRLVLRRFAQVAAVSQQVRQQLLQAGVPQRQIRLIRNGVELSLFTGATASLKTGGQPLVGLVGRLAQEKGVDLFLRAAAEVLKHAPETRFVVVGEGPDRIMLETLLDSLNLHDSTTLLGRRDDMAGVYASLTVLVSASRQEGMPVTILEAMASGLPIVATAVGEVPSLVVNGETGLLVSTCSQPDNMVHRLAEAMLSLLRNQSLRQSLGSTARKRVEQQFSARQMTADYLALYRDAISKECDGCEA